MTWKELKDKISLMTEEEQQKEVAVWGEKGKLLIVEDIDSAYDLVYFLTKSKPWEELSEKNHYMRWAYIEDLLPCKEEEGGGDNE